MKDDALYIAIDVETTGPRIGIDSMLSLGACVVTREQRAYTEKRADGLIFYVEMKPTSLEYNVESIKVGASQLVALKPLCCIPRFYPGHRKFEPRETLKYLQDCEHTVNPATAMRKFGTWVGKVGYMKNVIGVVDTTFFDSGFFNYYCTMHGGFNPLFGWSGLDLRSFWGGATGNPEASLKTVGVKDERMHPHRPDEDALLLAETARVVLYEKLPNR